jgi:DNA replication protein DnaC
VDHLRTLVANIQQPLHRQRLVRMQMQRIPAKPDHLAQTSPKALTALTTTPSCPQAVCSICKGAGFLRRNVPFGHAAFGKLVACRCKEQEIKSKRRQQLAKLSNLGIFAEKRFETFHAEGPGLQEAFQMVVQFAATPTGWLVLVGPNGCGKTHLAAAIVHACLENGAVVLFATVPDLLDYLRATFAPTSDATYDQLFALMREAEMLVLDDLGTQQSSPWANEKLFQLLNHRYNAGSPTVITANSEGLRVTDARIRSRLNDVRLVTALTLEQAHDYRLHYTARE